MLGSPAVGTASGPSLFLLLPPRPLPPQVRFLAGTTNSLLFPVKHQGRHGVRKGRRGRLGWGGERRKSMSDWEAGERGLVVREERCKCERDCVRKRENDIEREIKIL